MGLNRFAAILTTFLVGLLYAPYAIGQSSEIQILSSITAVNPPYKGGKTSGFEQIIQIPQVEVKSPISKEQRLNEYSVSTKSLTNVTVAYQELETSSVQMSSTVFEPNGTGGGDSVIIPELADKASIEFLAKEYTYGANGASIPVYFHSIVESNGIFNESDPVLVEVGSTIEIPVAPGTLTLFANGVYGSLNTTTASDSPTHAVLLTNGDNFYDIAQAKGIQVAFGMQETLESILGSRLDAATGLISLQPNKAILLVELDYSQYLAPKDYNDLVVEITFSVPTQTSLMLRDALGDPLNVGTSAISSGYRVDQIPPSTSFPASILNAPFATKLTSLDIAVAKYSTLGSIFSQTFRVRIWADLADAGANPWHGTIVDMNVSPTLIEQVGVLPNGKPVYMVHFDLTPYNINVPAGSFVFNLGIITPNSQAGLWGVLEAMSDTVAGPSDYAVAQSLPAPGYAPMCPGIYCTATGKVAFKLSGVSLSGTGEGFNGQ